MELPERLLAQTSRASRPGRAVGCEIAAGDAQHLAIAAGRFFRVGQLKRLNPDWSGLNV